MTAFKDPGTIRFSATLEGDTSGTFIQVPFDPEDLFGAKSRVPVSLTVNGAPYRGSLMPYRGMKMIGIPRAVREAAGAAPGDMVEVVLDLDQAAREVEVPAELAEELARDETAAAGWGKLSFTHQREYAEAINEAKRPETKVKRIEQALAAAREKAAPRSP
jgi:bifunctional DNA-binding transcriptional regulator/antitoxin component of YhaV-PrlF toxin-antitoxin module